MDSKPPQNNEEPADRLIEEFRQDSVKRPPDFAEECAMTAKVMDYARKDAKKMLPLACLNWLYI